VEINSVDNSWKFGVDANGTHYGDPFKGACQAKEINITITDVPGSTCSPPCQGFGDKKCPEDKPAGDTATPTCALTDPSGKKYCVLVCSPTLPIVDQLAADAQCGVDASCKPIQGTGICTYDDGAPTPPPAPPTPKPVVPTPVPAPTPPGTPPTISLTYTSLVTSKTTGDIPGLPKGTKTYTEYYDYKNKRRRLDFASEGYSKVYRYDVQDNGHTPFAAPRGYQFNPANPKLDCCWLWLVDTSDPTNSTNLEMSEVQLPKKASDEGSEMINGVTAEHWHAKGGVVVLESQSDWWVGAGNALVQQNSQFRLKLKDAIANITYKNYDPSPIDISIFDVPKADCQECQPFEIGTCKEFGKDPECDSSKYDATGDDFYFRR
jgi:hypothetical protein